MSDETIDLDIVVNGKREQRAGQRADRLLIDFLHEELGLTGTKFSCGVGACGACKVAIQPAEGAPLLPVLSCYARLKAVNGMHITTVEGLAEPDGQLHPLQQAFLDHYAFQCGFSTPGFLMAGHVLLDQLRRRPVPPDRLDAAILDAIGGQVCRCTGYVRYFEAIREVALRTPGCVDPSATTRAPDRPVSFRILKQSQNDLGPKVLIGYFEEVTGEVTFRGGRHLDTCGGWVEVNPAAIRTGEPVRDLNLNLFFFSLDGPRGEGAQAGDKEPVKLRFDLARVQSLDSRIHLQDLEHGYALPVNIEGRLSFGPWSAPAALEAFISEVDPAHLRISSRAPLTVDPRDLGFAVDAFAGEFGLKLGKTVEISLDLRLPFAVRP